MKPANEWNEDDVWALPPDENDTFERKGARLLDLTIGADVSKVLDELSKQLSAFSNTGGGQIIYGVTDNGEADNGGIARTVKGNTKAWIEDVIPILTEFEIVGCNVKEIQPKESGSKLAPDKSIYVVNIPASDRAPHQAKRDLKYYVRLGGKSQPAPHRLIEDIRNRQKHPSLDVAGFELKILQLPQYNPADPERYSGNIRGELTVRLKNQGRLMARNSCIHIVPSMGIRLFDSDNVAARRRSIDPFWELIDPLYPDMEFAFWIQADIAAYYPSASQNPPFGGPWLVGGKELSHAKFSWRLFADNAPTKEGEVSLDQLKFLDLAREALNLYPFARQPRTIFPML